VKTCLLCTGVLAAFLVIVAPLQATVLAPGGAAEPVSAEALPAGSIVSNGGNVALVSFTGIDAQGHTRYQGTLYFAVYQEAATGYLDFLYQIQNSKKSHDSLERTTNVDFSAAAGFVDAGYLAGGAPAGFLKGSRAPSTADLSDDSSVVGFNFPSGKSSSIGPGVTTDVYVISTHVKAFRAGSTSILNGAAVTVSTFAPGPEPSALVLFGGCFLGLAGWAGWRRWRGRSVSA
jgi:hypothetical protein